MIASSPQGFLNAELFYRPPLAFVSADGGEGGGGLTCAPSPVDGVRRVCVLVEVARGRRYRSLSRVDLSTRPRGGGVPLSRSRSKLLILTCSVRTGGPLVSPQTFSDRALPEATTAEDGPDPPPMSRSAEPPGQVSVGFAVVARTARSFFTLPAFRRRSVDDRLTTTTAVSLTKPRSRPPPVRLRIEFHIEFIRLTLSSVSGVYLYPFRFP